MTLECSVRSQERTVSVEEAAAAAEEEEEEEEARRPLSMLADKQRQSACSAATTTRGEAQSSLPAASAIDNELVKQAGSCGQTNTPGKQTKGNAMHVEPRNELMQRRKNRRTKLARGMQAGVLRTR